MDGCTTCVVGCKNIDVGHNAEGPDDAEDKVGDLESRRFGSKPIATNLGKINLNFATLSPLFAIASTNGDGIISCGLPVLLSMISK